MTEGNTVPERRFLDRLRAASNAPHSVEVHTDESEETASREGSGTVVLDSLVTIDDDPFNPNDHNVLPQGPTSMYQIEVVQLICGWLEEHGFLLSLQTLREEASLRARDGVQQRRSLKHAVRALEEGNWEIVQQTIERSERLAQDKVALYAVARQQFLEAVDAGDQQKAFLFFTRRIKPLESFISRSQFQMLAYTLTCKSVHEAAVLYPELFSWNAVHGRREVTDLLSSVVQRHEGESAYMHRQTISPVRGRLHRLLNQGYSYQLLCSLGQVRPIPLSSVPSIRSLLVDLVRQSPPIQLVSSIDAGAPVKSCHPLPHFHAIAAGLDDGTVMLYKLKDISRAGPNDLHSCAPATQERANFDASFEPVRLGSHEGRVWSMDSVEGGNLLLTSGGNGGLCLWDLTKERLYAQLIGHVGEVYACCLSNKSRYVASGTHNGQLFIWETETKKRLQQVSNDAAVISLKFSFLNTTVYAGLKSGTVSLIDVVSGVTTKRLCPPVATPASCIAVSPSATHLLVAYKNSSHRLWDLLKGELEKTRLTGHENISRNFVRACFGPQEAYIYGASEDGCIYVWEIVSRTELTSTGSASDSQWIDSGMEKHSVDNQSATATGSAPPQAFVRTIQAQLKHRLPWFAGRMVNDIKVSGEQLMLTACSDDGRICIGSPICVMPPNQPTGAT